MDTLVEPAGDLAGVQSPNGEQIPPERLGPGVVEEVAGDGSARVHWIKAGFDAWLEPGDLRSLGPNARLIEVYKRDEEGKTHLLRRRVFTTHGLQHNWTIELLPGNIIRTKCEDGASWTFKYNWVFERVEVWWPQPPDDDDAEALCAAELAVMRNA